MNRERKKESSRPARGSMATREREEKQRGTEASASCEASTSTAESSVERESILIGDLSELKLNLRVWFLIHIHFHFNFPAIKFKRSAPPSGSNPEKETPERERESWKGGLWTRGIQIKTRRAFNLTLEIVGRVLGKARNRCWRNQNKRISSSLKVRCD